MTTIAAFVAAGLLLAAAWRDVATRIIPDGISIALAATGLLARGIEGPGALAASVLAALLLFLILLVPAMRGALGGGDLKLATALAVGLPPLASYHFVVATAAAGGALALLYLACGRLVPAASAAAAGRPRRPSSLPRRVLAAEAWRIRRRGPLPYGVAIALGGVIVLLRTSGV